MKKDINPVVAVLIAVIVLVGVGLISLKLFGGSGGSGKQTVVKIDNPNDPKFRPDPRLAGGH
jgi:ABC-type cobalt transport system substrate-binding protein